MKKKNKKEILIVWQTAFPVLVAVISAWLAYNYTLKATSKNQEEAYYSTLCIIKYEVNWHQQAIQACRESMYSLKEASIEKEKIVLTDYQLRISDVLIQKSLDNIISHHSFNRSLALSLTVYMNQIREINFYLDFRRGIQLLENFQTKQERDDAIESYFNVLENEFLTKTEKTTSEIIQTIDDQLTAKNINCNP